MRCDAGSWTCHERGAHDLSSPRSLAKCACGVRLQQAPHRQIAGEQRRTRQGQGRRGVAWDVGGRHAIQQRADRARQQEGRSRAKRDSRQGHTEGMRHEHPDDVLPGRAEGDPDADFTSA